MKRTFRAGSVVGDKYEIIEYLSEGSLGDDIYRCKQIDLNREVALRIMPSMESDPEMVSRFIQEAKLTASLQHPNIIIAHDTGEYLGRAFLITEFVNGVNLGEYLKTRSKLEEIEALTMVLQLAQALDYAWEEFKILNRNIRPESILFTNEGVLKLEDFGMAKSFDSGVADLTMVGFTIGNPEYMSPEQVRGEFDLDSRSDIYCLGLVFYQMLTGKPPFEHESQIALMQAQLTEAHQPVNKLNSMIHGSTCRVIDKMLTKDKDMRHQSWKDVIADLNAVLTEREDNKFSNQEVVNAGELEVNNDEPEIAHSVKDKKDSQMPIMLGVIFFLIAVIIALLFYII